MKSRPSRREKRTSPPPSSSRFRKTVLLLGELAPRGAQELAHAEGEALLGAGEQQPEVEVLERPAVALGEAQRGGHAARVVVRARDRVRERDVHEQRHVDDQDHGRHELQRGEQLALEAGDPKRGAGHDGDRRPEQRREGRGRQAPPEHEARSGGVVVGDQHERALLVAVLVGDHVLRGAPAVSRRRRWKAPVASPASDASASAASAVPDDRLLHGQHAAGDRQQGVRA